MPSNRYTFDSARRGCDLILRVVAASPRPYLLHDLVGEWGVSWQTIRRVAVVATEAAGLNPQAGRLVRAGRGKGASLAWIPAHGGGGTLAQTTALAAALGPWRALGVDDVSSVLEQHLGGALASAGGQRSAELSDLLRRGFYYQPWMPRKMRDPEAFDEILSALFYGVAVFLEDYISPSREHRNVTFEPWTLVHALDGLYVLGPVVGEPEPRLWAVHRMLGARRCRGVPVKIPRNYRPESLLGHGYGPFLATPGATTLRVGAGDVAYVLESPLPGQVGEPEYLPDGSARVRLAVAPHLGVRFWARAVGAEIEDPYDGS